MSVVGILHNGDEGRVATNRHEMAIMGQLGDWAMHLPAPRAPREGEVGVLFIPARPTTPNDRMARQAKAWATKTLRFAVLQAWVKAGLPRGHTPKSVVLTRVGEKLLDDDNWVAAAKGARDQVARMCWMDDRARIWSYEQVTVEHRRGHELGVGVRVEVQW